MLFEELNNLLSIELELIKEISTYEARHLKNLKKLELLKEKLIEKNKDGAKKAIEKMRQEMIKKTQIEISKKNKGFQKEIKDMKERYESRKDALTQEFFHKLLEQAKNVYT